MLFSTISFSDANVKFCLNSIKFPECSEILIYITWFSTNSGWKYFLYNKLSGQNNLSENILCVTNCHVRIILSHFPAGYQCEILLCFFLSCRKYQILIWDSVLSLYFNKYDLAQSYLSFWNDSSFPFAGVTNVIQLSVRAQHQRTCWLTSALLTVIFDFSVKRGNSKLETCGNMKLEI